MAKGRLKQKRYLWFAVALAVLLLAIATGLAVAAGDPDLGWHVVASGGGGSSGGGYQLDGTAGQAAAGIMTGGDYELGSGFWGGGELTRAAYGIHLPIVVREH